VPIYACPYFKVSPCHAGSNSLPFSPIPYPSQQAALAGCRLRQNTGVHNTAQENEMNALGSYLFHEVVIKTKICNKNQYYVDKPFKETFQKTVLLDEE
jgi:hypothetical protein